MENELLATFYVESPEALYEQHTVATRMTLQSDGNWHASHVSAVASAASYNDGTGQRQRYKIDVFRDWSSWNSYYPLCRAGTYPYQLEVLLNGKVVLTRMLYITIQPSIQVYTEVDGQRIDLVKTDPEVVSRHPLVKTQTISKAAPHAVTLVESNNHKGTVFVKSNLPIDLVSDDLTDNLATGSYSARWVQLKDKITLTRKIGDTPYPWRGDYY